MKKIAVVYWSGTGNTEKMAEAIGRGIDKADAAAEVFSVAEFSADALETYDAVAFGCSAMGNEVLEESEFEPFFCEAESHLADKPVALFGSYGWGDGEWMRSWQARVNDAGAKLFREGLIAQGEGDAAECEEFGTAFAES